MGDLGESKGVVLWLLDRLSSASTNKYDVESHCHEHPRDSANTSPKEAQGRVCAASFFWHRKAHPSYAFNQPLHGGEEHERAKKRGDEHDGK